MGKSSPPQHRLRACAKFVLLLFADTGYISFPQGTTDKFEFGKRAVISLGKARAFFVARAGLFGPAPLQKT